MKKILTALLVGFALSAQAQKNVLLDQSFWQSKPDVNQVKAEVAKGSNPSQLNPMGFDPVVMAINAGVPNEVVDYLLLQPGNDVSKLTHDGRIYMHWAANRGNVALMEKLIAKGSKANLEDNHGMTVLNFAAASGQPDTQVYDLCLTNGAVLKKDLNHDGANALLLAIATDKDLKLTNYFVSKGLDLNSTDAAGNNAFSYAARGGNIASMKALVEKGVPAQDNAFIMASQGGRRGANSPEVFQYLESLNLKPNVTNKNGENALHAIVRRPRQQELIQYFLTKGVDVNQADAEGNTVFMNAAATNRDMAVMELLVPKVKNINQANQKGVTALAMAIKGNSPEVVTYLLSKGADVTVTDKKGDNLAAYLIQSTPANGGARGEAPARPEGNPRPEAGNGPPADEFTAKLKLLQEKGLDVKAPQKNGNTLYHLAVVRNDLSLLKKLEPLQIDVNSRNKEGITALHKAAMVSKDDALLKYLLSIGAKKDIPTDLKETAFDLASENESLVKSNVSLTFLK
ncbi:ankyrin repeat domain-containing protein [Spirosoma utsteinense]|uniref:ankyrin repeat domain-containing protein n=1 Tax=Spirosoma utsteinense TaxID=2585773 RepID=UPI0016486EBF|nr:ankyrin repeat domain-containing protein [Spirosoma utsteinense]MBC3785802.1 ankyrin repeat protein [Spirosoma utsteinense]